MASMATQVQGALALLIRQRELMLQEVDALDRAIAQFAAELAHAPPSVDFRRGGGTGAHNAIATVQAVRAMGGVATAASFAAFLRIPKATAAQRLWRATKAGLLEKNRPGCYRPVVGEMYDVPPVNLAGEPLGVEG